MYKNILAAIDNGRCMESVSEHAIKQAAAFNSKLTLCHIKKNTVISLGRATQAYIMKDNSYSIDTDLERIKQEAIDAGIKEVEIVQTYSSSPGIALADVVAPGYEVDLIIAGRSDKSTLNRLLLGSVSSNIINYAKCDVMLVRSEKD